MRTKGLCNMGVVLALVSSFVLGVSSTSAAAGDDANDRMSWWREARFGMFIHWGPYARLAGEWRGKRVKSIGEWIMYHGKIPVADYEEMARNFNPTEFNADEWVRVAKAAGMKYIVITAKHCDGFAMYPSKVTPYNIVDWTPFDRDPLKELRTACDKHGLKLGFYYSHNWDWHEPNALGLPNVWDFPDNDKKDIEKYLRGKSLPQVEELARQYSPDIMWFDVPSGPAGGLSLEQSERFRNLVRKYDPDCIINDRVGNGLGDYVTPEQYIPTGEKTDFEVCMTLNDTWGYKHYDRNWKTPETVIRNLVDIASKGGNYLLNVGPTGEGLIPPASVRILQEVGMWMEKFGESVYGTFANPLGPLPYNARITAKPGKLFLHLFDWPQRREIIVPGVICTVDRIYLLGDPDKAPLDFEHLNGEDLLIGLAAENLPSSALDTRDTVLVIEYSGPLAAADKPMLIDPACQTRLSPALATFKGEGLKYEFNNAWDEGRGYHIVGWDNPGEEACWAVRTLRRARYEVYVEYGAPAACGSNRFEILVGENRLEAGVQDTGGWHSFKTCLVGKIDLEAGEAYTLSMRAVEVGADGLMNLREVQLVPAP